MKILNHNHDSKIALTITDHSISYGKLIGKVEQMAQTMRCLPTGNILLKAKNSIHFIIQLLAAFLNNQTVVLISNRDNEQTYAEKLNQIQNIITIKEDGNLDCIFENAKGYKLNQQAKLVLFTSGSQDKPKAVMLSEKNILANCRSVIDSLDFASAKSQLLFLPLCYSFGLMAQLLPALMTGMTTCLVEDFSMLPGVLMSDQLPQMWSGVPSHWQALSQLFSNFPHALDQLTHVISAGDKLSLSLRQQLVEMFPKATIYSNYGLTEGSPRVLSINSKDPLFISQATGYPVGDWQLRLSQDNQLLLKGSQIMLGYIDGCQSKVVDGWLKTGDIASISNNNLVTLQGRGDDIINIDGRKVSLDSIENKLSMIGLTIIALAKEDKLHGSKLILCVEEAVRDEQLPKMIMKALKDYQLGFEIFYIDTFPKNMRGKIDRKLLKIKIEKSKG